MTIYKSIPGHWPYEAGDDGSIRKGERVLRQGVIKATGYPIATISGRSYHVHRLVLEAFVGPRPAGGECRHLDGNKHNNVLANLCWGTRLENEADRKAHGTIARGEKHGRSKLTEWMVKEIRALYAAGDVTRAELARGYKVSQFTIGMVLKRTYWAHVS